MLLIRFFDRLLIRIPKNIATENPISTCTNIFFVLCPSKCWFCSSPSTGNVTNFSSVDVVRHPLVKKIIDAYKYFEDKIGKSVESFYFTKPRLSNRRQAYR